MQPGELRGASTLVPKLHTYTPEGRLEIDLSGHPFYLEGEKLTFDDKPGTGLVILAGREVYIHYDGNGVWVSPYLEDTAHVDKSKIERLIPETEDHVTMAARISLEACPSIAG